MQKNSVVISLDRDLPLLLFLWRWKVATTRAIHTRYFSDCSLHRAYARLWRLSKADYLVSTHLETFGGSSWSLSRKGFKAIREKLPELVQEGFASEKIEHDLTCAAFHLGDWLCEQPQHASLFTEQQLRRYHKEMYPSWVPTSKVHVPDGYTFLTTETSTRLIAFEIELSRKTIARYQAAGIFYSHQMQIDRVLWLIDKASFINDVEKHLGLQNSTSIHNFVSLREFQKQGWQSKILKGPEEGLCISAFLNEHSKEIEPELCPNSNSALTFLDTRKSFYKATS